MRLCLFPCIMLTANHAFWDDVSFDHLMKVLSIFSTVLLYNMNILFFNNFPPLILEFIDGSSLSYVFLWLLQSSVFKFFIIPSTFISCKIPIQKNSSISSIFFIYSSILWTRGFLIKNQCIIHLTFIQGYTSNIYQ